MKLHALSFSVAGAVVSLALFSLSLSAQEYLIPRPAKMTVSKGFFKTDSAQLFAASNGKGISCQIDPSFDKSKPEGYSLVVNRSGVSLKAGTETGLFYGRQTLRQLLTTQGLPYVTIEDSPRFGYRGLHIDVSRTFFPKEEILKIIDVMSCYKLNRLHLHLTDNGGWRVQIDKYPKLTSDATYRTVQSYVQWSYIDKDNHFVKEGTPNSYGGYYTKQDIREMVAYALARHITIIPEIEFPAHSSEVFVAYPELCCSGEQYGNTAFCIGNEKTIQFMKDVLSEIVELFPSEYIHIGGDEANMEAWKKCEKCQALMKREGLKTVEELQSYMIRQCENFLKTKGRKIIGWDEILKGGIAPDATVMSWRGVDGGIAAARMNHDVIMTPTNYCYFDYYQADPSTQPLAIGGYVPVRRVYGYDPIPADSLTPQQQKHIIGAQGNTWSEFIPTTSHLEYMMFPRALAIAEIDWTPQSLRSWDDFKVRMNNNIALLHQRGINAFPNPNSVDILLTTSQDRKNIRVTLEAERQPAEIRYTTDGSRPTTASALYAAPFTVKDSAEVKAAVFTQGKIEGDVTALPVAVHKALGRSVHYYDRSCIKYPAEGVSSLTNGQRGSMFYLDGRWQGFMKDMDCSIDMGKVMRIHSVSTDWLRRLAQGIFEPTQMELLTSDDGVNYVSRAIIDNKVSQSDMSKTHAVLSFEGDWSARYVRLKAKILPYWFYGDVSMFTDEIVIW